MAKVKDLVYMVLDQLQIHSDDSIFTEDHIIFLLNAARAEALKSLKVQALLDNASYQTLCLDLEKIQIIPGNLCSDFYLKSTKKIPHLVSPFFIPKIFTEDLFNSKITMVASDTFKYVGMKGVLQNIIYGTIGPDNYLYIKSKNPQYQHLEKVKVQGIFNDFTAAQKLECYQEEGICDILEADFPIEDSLINTIIKQVVDILANKISAPVDFINNASDNKSVPSDQQVENQSQKQA